MTLNQLHKRASQLIKDGHKNKLVRIDKATFSHPLEGDGCTILDIKRVLLVDVPKIDGDGFVKTRKDGSQCSVSTVVIRG